MLRSVSLGAAIAALSLSAASASIVVNPNASGTGENVVFSTAILNGNTIDAVTNQNRAVTISSSEDLALPASGQARVEAADGTLSDLTWNLTSNTGYTLGVFNVNLHTGSDPNTNATSILITVDNLNGVDYSQVWTIPNSGFFTISTTNNSLIGAVSFSVVEPLNSSIDSISQIRLEGDNVTAVPEPATWAFMMLGFASIGAIAYRRKSKQTIRLV